MRKIKIRQERLNIEDKIVGFFEKKIVPHGNGAKILCPKEFIGKSAYVVIRC